MGRTEQKGNDGMTVDIRSYSQNRDNMKNFKDESTNEKSLTVKGIETDNFPSNSSH